MRIALLTNGLFPYVVGGMQKHSYYLTKYLARQGVYVDLFYALPPEVDTVVGKEDLFTDEERLFVRTVRVERHQSLYYPSHYIRSCYHTSGSMLEFLRQHPPPDFIYAQGLMGWQAIKAKRRGLRLPPIGVNPHGLDIYQKSASFRSQLEQWMLRPFVKHNLQGADFVLSLGGGLNRILFTLEVPPDRIILSSNGVAASWLVPEIKTSLEPRTFVFVGRYQRLKGIEELHAAIKHIAGRYDFTFHFVGPIPEEVRIASNKVHYWGLVRQETQVQEILQACDVLVCPSYAEGMPTVILEAMASGLAVIASRVGAVDALVSSENGWLIPPGDGRALAQALIDAITIPGDGLIEKKKCSRSLVEKEFLWDVIARKTVEGINAVL